MGFQLSWNFLRHAFPGGGRSNDRVGKSLHR
jgi:hypothetical protein